MPALLRDTGCRAHCRTERGSPSEGGTIARGEAPRTHATSPALELPILRRRVLGFSSWFRKGPYARVAEWQTRWLQVPVPFLGVEVQLLSRAHAGTPVRQGETPSQVGVHSFLAVVTDGHRFPKMDPDSPKVTPKPVGALKASVAGRASTRDAFGTGVHQLRNGLCAKSWCG